MFGIQKRTKKIIMKNIKIRQFLIILLKIRLFKFGIFILIQLIEFWSLLLDKKMIKTNSKKKDGYLFIIFVIIPLIVILKCNNKIILLY